MSLSEIFTLKNIAYGAAAAVVVNGVWNMTKKQPFFSMPSLGYADTYEVPLYSKTHDFNRTSKYRVTGRSASLRGLSSHQVRFGQAARACAGRNQKGFRACMKRSL